MPNADVAVIGAGLAGLATAVRLAERGARVVVLAQGNGALQWAGGPIDVAARREDATPAGSLANLANEPGHPYRMLAADVPPALDWFAQLTAAADLAHLGGLDDPFRALPTGIGGTRPIGTVPESQAAAREPWVAGERLVLVGPAGFKDFWPRAVAAGLNRPGVWGAHGGPDRVDGVAVELPGLTARRNLNALRVAELFDEPSWRRSALETIARATDGAGRGPTRVGLPAVLGCRDHPTVFREAVETIGRPLIELPIVPPGIPGIRLYDVLRAALRTRGGRLLLGEPVARVEVDGRQVVAVATTAATREVVTRVGALVLATGGLHGGGLVGDPSGRIVETVLDLPVEGPPIERWMTGDALDPGAMPIATSGLRTDDALRPVDPARPGDGPLFENVRIVGALLAGQRYLAERCGDGVALASAWRAAASLATEPPAAIGAGDADARAARAPGAAQGAHR